MYSGVVKTPDDAVSIAPEAFNDRLNWQTLALLDWQNKPIDGQYVSNLYDNYCAYFLDGLFTLA